MAPKQQRTLMDSWAEPAKRRRLNNNPVEETKQSPKSTQNHPSPSPKNHSQPQPHHQNPHHNPQPHLPLRLPPSTLLCHATNAQGTWGAGIASAFQKTYPCAFKIYKTHCTAHKTSALLGTTLLIPPQTTSASKSEREANHWIGCLFTSEKKGKGKGSEESILRATGGAAVSELVERVREVNDAATANSGADSEDGEAGEVLKGKIEGVRMCKINSGLFGVPWEATKAVIEAVEVGEGDFTEVVVCSLD